MLLKAKGKSKPVLLPSFSCHTLIHTFTTRLCEFGINVKVIQDVLGHADFSTTLDESPEAFDRMQYIAGRIYKAFMGDRFYSVRYMLKENEDLRKQITYEKLISKLERECEAML